ncbi:MAG: response regulator transcription factor [Deltaproteobacteria bacterium]|nr:response regulator transcription factor [Deltaproteobacteria bacterium]
MDKVKAIIADDEPALRSALRHQLAMLWPELHLAGEAGNGVETLELVEREHPDIAFLDIRMPGLSGIQVAERIVGSCRVVFITAYDQYALEAFEKEAVDYILKPVTRARLEKTIRRLQKEMNAAHDRAYPVAETMARVIHALETSGRPDHLRWIKAQYGNSIRLIAVDEVCYFKSSDKYTLVRTKNDESLIRKSITSLSEELDPGQFWRIHRGIIVNTLKIGKVHRSVTGKLQVILKDIPETLTVSRSYTYLFRQM